MCISWIIGPKSWRTGFSSQRTLFLTLSTCSELSPSTVLTDHCEGTDARIGTTPHPLRPPHFYLSQPATPAGRKEQSASVPNEEVMLKTCLGCFTVWTHGPPQPFSPQLHKVLEH